VDFPKPLLVAIVAGPFVAIAMGVLAFAIGATIIGVFMVIGALVTGYYASRFLLSLRRSNRAADSGDRFAKPS
jgi:membrane associated rhomboid family serine protease